MHPDGVFRDEMLSEMLGTVGGAMLPAGAAETDLKMREATGKEALHVNIDQGIDIVQELEYLAVFFEKVNDGLIQSGQLLEPFILPRIMH